MKSQNKVCGLCQNGVRHEEAVFYFPILPPNHPLADIKGIVHVSCLKTVNALRKIDETLAGIAEDIARNSESAPLIVRQGNIVVRNRVDEERIEILDFEDFCEISIPSAIIGLLRTVAIGESVSLGMQTLHIKENGSLSIEFKYLAYKVDLPALNLDRLLLLLS